jgi:hypothetical protein
MIDVRVPTVDDGGVVEYILSLVLKQNSKQRLVCQSGRKTITIYLNSSSNKIQKTMPKSDVMQCAPQ